MVILDPVKLISKLVFIMKTKYLSDIKESEMCYHQPADPSRMLGHRLGLCFQSGNCCHAGWDSSFFSGWLTLRSSEGLLEHSGFLPTMFL